MSKFNFVVSKKKRFCADISFHFSSLVLQPTRSDTIDRGPTEMTEEDTCCTKKNLKEKSKLMHMIANHSPLYCESVDPMDPDSHPGGAPMNVVTGAIAP